jgi:hypothetical protein
LWSIRIDSLLFFTAWCSYSCFIHRHIILQKNIRCAITLKGASALPFPGYLSTSMIISRPYSLKDGCF